MSHHDAPSVNRTVGPARPRRLRRSAGLRTLVQETVLAPADFVLPLFVEEQLEGSRDIPSMPGVRRRGVERTVGFCAEAYGAGVPGVLLFGIPQHKDANGSSSWAAGGVVQEAVRAIKREVPDLIVMTDVCLCEYTDHGHCGILDPDGTTILNDETLDVLDRVAASHADAGADVVAPSGMMDGAVSSLRSALDEAGHVDVAIVSYSTKYASAYFAPFREAVEGTPRHGDRRSHQMDPANAREALRENALDVEEGADALMVKPALAYLDILQQTRAQFPGIPLAAYNVSGEYAMVKAAAASGWVDERTIVLENLLGMKRAGADWIITYHALDAARWLAE